LSVGAIRTNFAEKFQTGVAIVDYCAVHNVGACEDVWTNEKSAAMAA